MISLLGIALITFASSTDAQFAGWQGMRVIYQEGHPGVMRAIDVDSDGRDELVVVNTNHSRLDVYQWLGPGRREPDEQAGEGTHLNDLPMPDEFTRQEIPLKHLPHDVVAYDADGDGKQELAVLVSPPNKVLVYALEDAGNWVLRDARDLLTGDFAPSHKPLLLDVGQAHEPGLLIGCTNGIQYLSFAENSRACWLTPREMRTREDWWLADLDGDGDQDLVEQAREAHQSLRWFERVATGHLTPACTLFDQSISEAALLYLPGDADQLMVLDGTTDGLLHRYRLGAGAPRPLGRQRPLAISDGRKAIWCGVQIEEQPALVIADPQRPQLLMYQLVDDGWGVEQAFPAVNDVRAMVAPLADPGMLLLWAEDAADLHVSRWDGARMSYPRPWPDSNDTTKRSILGLGTAGQKTWWLQQVDDACDLYVWDPGHSEPVRSRFDRVTISKGGHVQWLGGERLLARSDYRAQLKIVSRQDSKTISQNVTHLQANDVSELKLIPWGDDIRIARLTDGVMQWLDDELQPIDQIMLPEDRKLADYVAVDQQHGWALQEGGRFIHRLEADESGIYRLTESVHMHGGFSLVQDHFVGLVLVTNDQVIHLDQGQPAELELAESFDGRIDRRSGIKRATIHRIDCLDLDGDGKQDILLSDDRRHQLTVLGLKGDQLRLKMSWPVFEDKSYPYGEDDEGPTISEPRVVVAWDADGDGRQDLAMLCHDRLVLYLAREQPDTP